jgi:hypothetical protein
LVVVVNVHAPVPPVKVSVLLPSVIDLTPVPLEDIPALLTAKFPVLNAPAVTKIALVVLVKALPNVQPPPTPLKVTVIAPSVTLFVVTVLPVVVAKKFMAAPVVVVNVIPVAVFDQLP